MNKSLFSAFGCALLLLFSGEISAQVRLPGFFSDHMVLQRQAPIPIWGWASPGEQVTVKLGDVAVTAETDASGHWRADLPTQEANATGRALTFASESGSTTLKDILVGEVWLCSGQSNMEWSVAASLNPSQEIASANFPLIRQMKIAHVTSGVPQDDVSSQWQICSPETAGSFTAAGYYMARQLHKELDVPIGLLNISWGGTRIDPWTPIEGFAEVPALANIHEQVSKTLPDNPLYHEALQKHIDSVSKWLGDAQSALANNQSASPTPEFPTALKPLTSHGSPTAIFNAMLNPVVGYGMRGAIWYQGESNHTEGMLYYEKKKALLAGWRKLWGIGDFPCYFVQIAPYHYGVENPNILAKFWEAQSACLKIPNTGMVVTTDIGNVKNIHPKNKQEVGRRLALLALKNTYGKSNLIANGPQFESMKVEGDKLYVKFGNVAGGLKSRDGEALSHFEVIGEQAHFVPATATIEGDDTITLHSPDIKEPAAMRFGWHKLAEPNLANGAYLPAAAFRAGEVPVYDFLAIKVEESAEYELVYDLDLKTLGPKINYTIDRSGDLNGKFDRIGYFIELRKSDGSLEWAWATMDPFSDDIRKIGIPFAGSGIQWQKPISNLRVLSSIGSVSQSEMTSGNIEFWSSNYGPINSGKVPGASTQRWDIGDRPEGTGAGYGCMQVHNTNSKQTVFAINHWSAGPSADVGIGNSQGRADDWTFASNAGSMESARLRVLVRMAKP